MTKNHLITRRQTLECFTGLTLLTIAPERRFLAALAPTESQELVVCAQYATDGELIRAWYGESKDKVQVVLDKKAVDSKAGARLRFAQGEKNTFLQIYVEIEDLFRKEKLGMATLT